MATSPELHKLISDAETGSEEAVWNLVELLTPHIYRVVNRKMSPSLRQRIGASDIVQATWASFLIRDRDLRQFKSDDDLTAFVTGIALNKLRMQARAHFHTQARDVRREVSSGADDLPIASDNQPTASDILIFRESWDGFMSSQPAHYRQIVQLRIDGHTYDAIAAQLRINERTVRRVLQKLAAEVVT